MNKQRRKTLSEIYDKLTEVKDALEEIKDTEEECRDNIPENLWNSERYKKAEETCDNLDLAVSSLEEVLDYIDSAKE